LQANLKPVTPEVAGSSPVAPVGSLWLYKANPDASRHRRDVIGLGHKVWPKVWLWRGRYPEAAARGRRRRKRT